MQPLHHEMKQKANQIINKSPNKLQNDINDAEDGKSCNQLEYKLAIVVVYALVAHRIGQVQPVRGCFSLP